MIESTIYFDQYELKAKPLALLRNGRSIELSSQPLRLLQLLAAHSGQIVTHDQIRDHLWRDQVVDFSGSIHVCVSQIRTALDDSGKHPRFVETIPRQGYRFLAPLSDAPPRPVETDVHARPNTWRRRATLVAVVTVALVAAALFWRTSPSIPTPSPASDAYKRGLYVLDSDSPDRLARSRQFFAEAIQSDPGYAPAYAALANTYQQENDLASARGFAQRALALDDDLAEAHLRMASVLGMADWDWEAAEQHVRRALVLDPKLAEAHHALASIYSVTGRSDAAIPSMEEALAIDPVSTLLRADFGYFLYYQGNLDEAEVQCGAALRLDAEHHQSRLCLLYIAVNRGDYGKAVALAEQIMRSWQADEQEIESVSAQPDANGVASFQQWRLRRNLESDPDRVSPIAIAVIQASLGDREAALAALERAVTERRPLAPFIVQDPIFLPLRHEARFQRLLSVMNVVVSEVRARKAGSPYSANGRNNSAL